MEKSSLKLVSNIMLKSKFEKTWESRYAYLPFDLLPSTYSDRRSEVNLSDYQRIQKLKKMFESKNVLEDTNEE